jgi:hypothetical protein
MTIPKYSAEHQSVRDTLIHEAIKAGKLLPSRYQCWAAQFDADPEGTKVVLARLAPVLVQAGKQAMSGAGIESSSDYDQTWLSPSERARLGIAQGGQRPIIDRTHD